MIHELARPEGLEQEAGRRVTKVVDQVRLHADRSVRAHDRALSTVDAQIGLPDRELCRQLALLDARGAGREGAVERHRRYRQLIAVAGDQRSGDACDEIAVDDIWSRHPRTRASID